MTEPVISQGGPPGLDVGDVLRTLRDLGHAPEGAVNEILDHLGLPRSAVLGSVTIVRRLDPVTVRAHRAPPPIRVRGHRGLPPPTDVT